jgi:hypothetical protein
MPVLARVYGIPPREQASLTLQQFRALRRDFEQLKEG